MIALRTSEELKKLREAGRISAGALKVAGESIKAGMSTKQLDDKMHKYILSQGAKPNFLGYNGFPGCACISINDEVIHGIPSEQRKFQNGDIVSIDVGAIKDGYHGDNAYTFAVGNISSDAKKLLETTEKSLYEAIKVAKPGNRIGDISHAIQSTVEEQGFGVVREFVGHGVGKALHESPEIPNFGTAGRGIRLAEGMVIAIEPMINLVGAAIIHMPDGWTIKTKSGSLSAHFEHTIAITGDGAKILTKV